MHFLSYGSLIDLPTSTASVSTEKELFSNSSDSVYPLHRTCRLGSTTVKLLILNRMKNFWHNLLTDEAGVTTVEYALLLALILVFCISAILSSGEVQEVLWFNTATRIEVINP